jgi:segregation and condensation protein A
MQTQDMNIMSEFLVMAATLIDIKCRMLLPREVNEEGEEQDPREELVQKLLEYKMYKYMAFELRDRQVDAAKSWYKKPQLPKEVEEYKAPIDYEELVGDTDLAKLHEIFKAVMKRQEDKIDPIRSGFGKIEKDEINLEEKELYIGEYVKSHKTFSFRNLLERQGSKMEVIVTFMAILELMKQGAISIEQESTFSDIIITSALAA